MSDQHDHGETPEFPSLSQLKSGPQPPSALEDQVALLLRRHRLLDPPAGGRPWVRRFLATAAVLLIFLAGAVTGANWSSRVVSPPQGEARFLLLLGGTDPASGLTREQYVALVKEYSDWGTQLRRRGLLELGEKLDNEGRILNGTGVQHGGGGVTGLFLIRANDYEQAVATAMSCPHLRHGGTIEIRRIER